MWRAATAQPHLWCRWPGGAGASPTSNSLPSGHSASAAAFAVGVGLESPPSGLGLALLAGLVGLSRVADRRALSRRRARRLRHRRGHRRAGRTGRAADRGDEDPHRRPAAGRYAATARRRGRGAGDQPGIRQRDGRARHRRGARGAAAEPRSSNSTRATTSRRCCARRPSAPRCSPSAAATARCRARRVSPSSAGMPLAVFPGGTFNHFAKDIGCDTVAKTVDAIRRGSVACVDVVLPQRGPHRRSTPPASAPTRAFVQTREKLEHKIGKPLAGLYAMFHTLRRDEPVRIAYDNKTLQTSLFFLGNSTYLPSGFAPSRRTEDGRRPDRRSHSRDRPHGSAGCASGARWRWAGLTRSPLYHEMRVPEFTFTAVDGPTVLAHDGEVGTEMSTRPASACSTGRCRCFVRCRDGAATAAPPAGTRRTRRSRAPIRPPRRTGGAR